MDAAYEYLWAAGYDLPPETQRGIVSVQQGDGTWTAYAATTVPDPKPRRGKKAAKAKRAKL